MNNNINSNIKNKFIVDSSTQATSEIFENKAKFLIWKAAQVITLGKNDENFKKFVNQAIDVIESISIVEYEKY